MCPNIKELKKEEPQALKVAQKKSCKRNNWRGRPRKEGKKSKSGSEPKPSEEDKGGSTKKNREQEPTKIAKARTSSSSSQEGGFVLIDKKYESLEATVRAYKSRVEAQLDMPKKLK